MGMIKRSSIRVSAVCIIALLLLLALASPAAPPNRVVAIGDVHGAYEELVAILQRTGLIDGNRKWIGGSTILVQAGDVVDRGPRIRECLDLLMDLEQQAPKQSGKLIPLFGNHEVMVIMGDLRYVTQEEYRSFATDKSEEVREQAYRDYLRFLSGHQNHAHPGASEGEAARRAWMERHPLGFFEYRDAFRPAGKYGRWLRRHRALVKVGEGLFVHGGINPGLDFRSVDALDDQVRDEIAGFDLLWQWLSDQKLIWRYMTLEEAARYVSEELNWRRANLHFNDPDVETKMKALLEIRNWMAVSPDGPLWYRGLAEGQENGEFSQAVEEMFKRLKVQYIVSGHTVRDKSGVTSRFNNRVFLIDTGMLKQAYDGRPSALEIQNGRFTAFYADGNQKVLVAPAGASVMPPSAAAGNPME